MSTQNRPMRLIRALGAPGFAAGLLIMVPLGFSGYRHSAPGIDFPSLGAAGIEVVLGGAGVTCTSSSVTGVVSSKLTVTKSETCSISGVVHQGDASAMDAFAAFLTSYDDFKAMSCPPANNLTGKALAGMTLKPGVYCFNTTANLTSGNLTLAGSGTYVFQVGSGITTGSAQVNLTGGGQACNVYWVTGTNATIGSDTRFQGNILSGSGITFTGTNSSLVGSALAKTAVTMTGSNISGCGVSGGRK